MIQVLSWGAAAAMALHVPRYYFHHCDSERTNDEEGVELSSVQAARSYATDCARDMCCADLKEGWLNLDHRIEVADEAGEHILTITYREAFELRN